MGEFTRKRPRSPSMSRYGDDDSSNFSDSLTASSASDDDRYRSRSGKGSRRRKKRRYSDVLSSDSSSSSEGSSDDGSDSDLLLSRRKLPTSRASVVSDPMSRFNGPLTEMMAQMSTVMDKCTTRADKLMAKVKKLESLKKKIDVEMRELGKELRMQRNSGSPQIGQSEVVAAGGPGYFQNLSRDPLPIPPSLKPVSINANGSSSSNGGSSSSSSHLLPDDSHAFPHPRASGFRRVFEKSTYSLPIGTQPTLAVLSVGPMNVFEKAFGKKPRPMEINPFSHQTQFDGIAASSSLDGHIQFWDINAQKLMLSVPPRENRVIPYAETLTWVSEDAIVAVSHLKTGSRWPEPSAEPSNAELTTHSAPEAQTNLITIYFNREGQLGFRVLTITTMPHLKPINTVTAVMGEDHSVSYVTGGSDKRLFHWKFGPPDNQSLTGYEPQGLVELHQAHSNSITSTMYSHTSKTLYSGGLDGKYVSFSLEHQKVIREQRLGQVLHIVQNPMDPRINLVAVLSRSRQYLLVDERTPTQTVLNVGYWTQSKISKLSVPSWQPGGGLLCTGASTDGAIYLWDVRWNSIKTEINRRPGKGVVIGDVKYNGAVKSQNHPIFRNQLLQPEVPLRDTPGGPSQILEIPGKKVVQACFHPTKNVMMIINSDCNLTFIPHFARYGLEGIRPAPVRDVLRQFGRDGSRSSQTGFVANFR
ncbi:hypothetical protein BGX31_003318 [Mortierella sp. GBA43]|nr:hypothetical protein BGX31_003318 [Mortierella sp. GBA43]